ncbi:hypothetical protein ACFPM3_04645 [Streptomyces coeruleoprunus]|uniref:Uncharacterized protein n=1 Tax=Streptomyces coeruleoprunus TaxID=285563 RepID=A0ABV9XBA3_9ACTN
MLNELVILLLAFTGAQSLQRLSDAAAEWLTSRARAELLRAAPPSAAPVRERRR